MVSLKKWLYLIVIPSTLLLLPVTVFADTGQPATTTQSTTPTFNGAASYKVGSNFSGTMTDIEFSGTATVGSPGDWDMITFSAVGYTDNTYATTTGDRCGQNLNDNVSSGHTAFTGTQLASLGTSNRGAGYNTPAGNGTNGCNFQPGEFYIFNFGIGTSPASTLLDGTAILPAGVIQVSNDFDNIAMPYVRLVGVSGGFDPGSFPGPNTHTRIVSFTPEEGTTTGNNVTFNLHVYINPDDLGTLLGIQLDYHNIDQNSLLSNIPFVTHDIVLFAGQATTSGDFYFTATSTLPDGNYRVQASIKRTLANTFINPFSSINDTQNHQYVVNQGTYIGHLNQNGFTEFNSIFASTSATSTAAAAGNCNPVSFNVSLCLAFLFVPGGPQLDQTIQSFQDGIATRMPWGYFYRIYTILSSTASTSLPSYTADIVIGPPGNLATTSLTYDPGDMINGAAVLLGTIQDNQHGKTFREVMEPFVQLTVALAVIFGIFADVTGSHKHHTQVKSGKSGKLS